MATPAPPRPIANGPVSGGPSTSRPRDWSRTGEPGSAFSGIGRGRRGNGGRGGRGGRSGGRGGRGGGGGTLKPADTPADASAPPPPSAQPTKPTPPKLTPTQKQPSTTSPVTPTSAKGKSSSRRSSRNSPAANPPTPSTDVPPTPTTASRTSNRRQRSQNQSKVPKDVPKINAPPPTSERPSRQRSRPAPLNAPPKAASPSPSNTNHRPDIDALVERVRASAMAEARPTTPGSHIDWAGDEDDSLPDLDDWGVKPKFLSEPQDSAISPIIVEGLTPLPDLVSKPSFAEHDGLSPSMASIYPPSSGSPPQMDAELPEESKKEEEVSLKKLTQPPSFNLNLAFLLLIRPEHPFTLPYLPNLFRQLYQATRDEALRRAENNKNGSASKPAEQPKPIEQSKPTEQTNATETSVTTENSKPDLEQSLHAQSQPKPLLVVDPPKPGLEASIHAPKPGEPISAPSDITTYAASRNGPHAYNPTHNRNFTVGRQLSIQHPSPMHLNPRNARSGASTPRRGFVQDGYHARTHSSPPTVDNHRPHHTSRPVLTGDALSRLARTIGGISPRSTVVAGPKE
ncbi:hypothetical protein EDD18DRAFT_1157563 [Armillaria luteobubalina]|uniref:Uncharacterized protein n=1 Tax=Armillaria luteobubalina TaxID=153913 RepID=A0AA39Q9T7_9AGAR|nr:hypothetical protein EDD18DRAFT_1157563 [Armillaria luteobubalina]